MTTSATSTRDVPSSPTPRPPSGSPGPSPPSPPSSKASPTRSERVHHFRLTRDAAEDVFRTLAVEPTAQRRHNPGLEPGRVDTIVGGAIILVVTMRALELDELLVSEDDILDGLARSLRSRSDIHHLPGRSADNAADG